MHSLMDKQYLLTLDLIEIFYVDSNKNSISYFSSSLNIDPRTLNKILVDLKYDIKKNGLSDQLSLKTFEKEIYVEFTVNFSLEIIYTYYMSKSICVDLCLSLFNNHNLTIDSFCNQHYISRPTLYRKLIPLKDKLKEFDLSLNFSSKEIIFGNENQIRYFFYLFFKETLKTNQYFSSHHSKKIEIIIELLKAHLTKHITFFHNIEILLYITFTRIEHKYIIKNNSKKYTLPDIFFTFEEFYFIVSPIFIKETSLSSTQIKDELTLLYFLIITSNIYPLSSTQMVKVETIDFTSNTARDAQKWISYFNIFFKIEITSDEYFYLLLNLIYLITKRAFFPGENSYSGKDNFNEILKKEPLYNSKKMEIFFVDLEKKDIIKHLDARQKYYYFVLSREIFEKHNDYFKLLLISKHSEVERLWFQSIILNKSSVPLQFELDFTVQTNLIISDYSLKQTKIKVNSNKHFHWLAFSNKAEIDTLVKKIETIYHNELL